MLTGPIIVIDDDTDDHFIFDEVCQKLKLVNELKFFRNGPSALHYLKTTLDQPFIIFCDMNMPRMNGIELRRVIDQDVELKKKSIPFVFFTTAASRTQINEAYDLTVQGFFIKESSFEDTEKVLRLIFEYWQKCRLPKGYC